MSLEGRDFGDLTERYELLEVLGAGGMGTVVRARRRADGVEVAIKFARAVPHGRRDARLARFRREARALERLSHPNNVRVLEARQSGDTAYLVMALAPGLRLRDLPRPMAPARALAIGAQLCAALAEAHGLGLVHRDVKPANILVEPRGGADHVTLVDYGLARIEDDATPLTSDSAVVGTANYISPEQLQGRDAEPRSDLYAVGVVLYELLSGRPPFEADTPYALAYQHVHSEPAPLELGGDRGAEIDGIVLRCLAKAPSDRYGSAEELGAALARLSRGTADMPAARAAGRRRGWLALAAAVLGLAVVGTGTWGALRTTEEAPTPTPPALALAEPAQTGPPPAPPTDPGPERVARARRVALESGAASHARRVALGVSATAATPRPTAAPTAPPAPENPRSARRERAPRAPSGVAEAVEAVETADATEAPSPHDSESASPGDDGDAERLRQRVLMLRLQEEARAVGRAPGP